MGRGCADAGVWGLGPPPSGRSRGGRVLHARQRPQPGLSLAEHSQPPLLPRERPVPRYEEREHSARIVPGIDAAQLQKTPEHESRADQQHEGQRDLDHHHQVAQPATGPGPGGVPTTASRIASGLAELSAGNKPNNATAANPDAAAKASTRQSMEVDSIRGRFGGASRASPWTPSDASPTATSVPSIESSSASVTSDESRATGFLPTPRARRTRVRAEMSRASSRFATLAHAISNRKITEPISARMAGRTSSTRSPAKGSIRSFAA